jgi:hypothetical protein
MRRRSNSWRIRHRLIVLAIAVNDATLLDNRLLLNVAVLVCHTVAVNWSIYHTRRLYCWHFFVNLPPSRTSFNLAAHTFALRFGRSRFG